MPEKPGRKIILPPGGGVFQDLTLRVKLILRLIGDGRVNALLKLLPIGSLAYLVMPDLAVGPIDDAAIIWLATYLFVELCPPNVVQEHLEALVKTKSVMQQYGADQPTPGTPWPPAEGEIIDGEVIEETPREEK
ncbi:MAG TPA: hypothetical protein VLM83_06080 [Anaerolineales bacterium]|nr:hypothetical protein [Anaerolineales bacterium]